MQQCGNLEKCNSVAISKKPEKMGRFLPDRRRCSRDLAFKTQRWRRGEGMGIEPIVAVYSRRFATADQAHRGRGERPAGRAELLAKRGSTLTGSKIRRNCGGSG